MPRVKLFIGNKNYSSWSMRPWVLMREAGIPFEEILLRFDGFSPGSRFKTEIASVSGAGRVPVLVDGDLHVWDSLAIAEYLAERFPDRRLWPRRTKRRARARSVCAEMHSGFSDLRTHCPMNIDASLPEIGARVLSEHPGVRADLERIVTLWSGLLSDYGGPFLFGKFSTADAYFAPVVMRMRTYALPVPADIDSYAGEITRLDSVSEWIRDAIAEKDFVPFEEPYRAVTSDKEVE